MTHPPADFPRRYRVHNDPSVVEALRRVLEEGAWADYHGPYVQRLEQQLAELHRVAFAYCCCSGTFAVELALRAVGVGSGDQVILAGYDFPGNFRAVEAIGARPVLVDIEPDSWCLDPHSLTMALRECRPKGILVSHLHGSLADMKSICDFARNEGLAVVEDACQATGAIVQGRMAGTWGDAGTLSFGGSKLLTAGRGGAMVTDRADVLQRAKIHCEQGNHAFPLSELQAAILLPQLAQLAERNRRRGEAVAVLAAEFQRLKLPGRLALPESRGDASYYKLGWLLPEATSVLDRSRLLTVLAQLAGRAATGDNEAAGKSWQLGEGFRGFARRSLRRCHPIGSLAHSRSAAERTLLIHHSDLLHSQEYLRSFAEFIHQGLHVLAEGGVRSST